ncbi:ABC transporter substrate-binding protein [Modestobacter muralis]|uniref:ABC transporter substrate-binding protein n=1 Tax=Modestobacter muralis TaxID=1608614 RepID=A0A6P0HDK2_9ACTN|nr:ABC transporter substrate-binding protein [Modestobacter muralis]NEK95216.1 ABC transporter substrate-binding protein [Modestobacter muralis]NEN52104.1 ABC transporter substrate-binding protein [Modestobacter muralis]
MSRLNLTFACGDYDRTRALEEGTVRPEGIDLTYLRLPVEETFFRMMRYREFEVAEMSLSSYVKSLDLDEPPFVALPVYTSRQFRHAGIFVNTESGIEKPEDLRGKVVGTPEWQLTANVWIRGFLDDQYGVPVDSVEYRTGGQETPGRIEKAAVDLGDRIRISPVGPGQTLSRMLADGEIDAFQGPRVPSSFVPGGNVRRLFADPVAAEKQYFAGTGIFPIMHVVVVRRDVYERHPWVAQTLTKALHLAKSKAAAELYDASALRFMLPWLIPGLEEARTLLGEDYWSYGLQGNEHVLATFLRYHHEQGLSRRQYEPGDLFAPESTERFVI